METVTLFRPVGPMELELIQASGWKSFPPRLPDQPIFYPVTNHAYATQIARDWNVKASGPGFVTRLRCIREPVLRRRTSLQLDAGGPSALGQERLRVGHLNDFAQRPALVAGMLIVGLGDAIADPVS